uniref:F-box domain-containing protein n=1 Tax=Meloidogyne enterolobii TaxID=390850 RepID=A0A6V7UCS2_MELEN|nr:unnamed protein product [Meloidogyne enterolobii]
MYLLPSEVQLDIFKYLKFNQLLSIQQTNLYFRNFINKYEEELARKEFDRLEIVHYTHNSFIRSTKIIKPNPNHFEFQLSKHLEKKWIKGIEKSIPMFLSVDERNMHIAIYRSERVFCSILPNFPKNIEEMKIARYLLDQLFKCAFETASFLKAIFNPQMIKLLFDENKTNIPLQIHSEKAFIFLTNNDFEKFALNHLISNKLTIYSGKQQNIFKILTNGANKFSTVCCSYNTLIHDLIIQHIETSKNISKTVKEIKFYGFIGPLHKLKSTNDQISNKYSSSTYNKEINIDYIDQHHNNEPVYDIIIKRNN